MRMRATTAVITLFILIVFPSMAFGQVKAEPEDPGALFPSVVLEIEDLSIEKVDAGLPDEEKLMTFERSTPLPEPGEIPVAEPAVEPLLPVFDTAFHVRKDKSFYTEVLFGAGLPSNLLSEITFYRLGLEPVVRLFLRHENADGFAANQIGLGYFERQDVIEGEIKYRTGAVDFQASAGFKELEQGLQEQTAYYSLINQFTNGKLFFSYKAADLLTLRSSAFAAITGFRLTGASPPAYTVSYPPTEYRVGGEVGGELRSGGLFADLGVSYSFRNIPGDAAFDLHRFKSTLNTGAGLADWLDVEAGVSFFSSGEIPCLFPFQLTLKGYPLDRLSVSLSGGYRLQERDLSLILDEFSFADMPGALRENHGWYGTLNAQLSFENALLFIVDATLSENSAYLWQSRTPDGATGLFPEAYTDNITVLETGATLRFPVFPWLSINSVGRLFLPFSDQAPAKGELGAEAALEDVEGVFGVSLLLTLKTDFSTRVEFPYLDASAYLRLFDNMKFIIEGLDLLSPLLDGARYAESPYLSPGIRARFKFQISF